MFSYKIYTIDKYFLTFSPFKKSSSSSSSPTKATLLYAPWQTGSGERVCERKWGRAMLGNALSTWILPSLLNRLLLFNGKGNGQWAIKMDPSTQPAPCHWPFSSSARKLGNVREGCRDQKLPKYRHCLNGGGLTLAWIFVKDLSTCTEGSQRWSFITQKW